MCYNNNMKIKIILSIVLIIGLVGAGTFFFFYTTETFPVETATVDSKKDAAFVFLSTFDGIPVSARSELTKVMFAPADRKIAGYQTPPLSSADFALSSLLENDFIVNTDLMSDGTTRSSAVYERYDMICLVETSAEMLDETTMSDTQTTLTCGSSSKQ